MSPKSRLGLGLLRLGWGTEGWSGCTIHLHNITSLNEITVDWLIAWLDLTFVWYLSWQTSMLLLSSLLSSALNKHILITGGSRRPWPLSFPRLGMWSVPYHKFVNILDSNMNACNRVTTLQTMWNSLTIPWRFTALLPMLSVTHIMPVLVLLSVVGLGM